MVEEVTYEEDDKDVTSEKSKRDLIIGFYLWNLNLYLITLISFSNIFLTLFMFVIINSLIFRTMFGFQRFNRAALCNVFLAGLFIWNYGWFSWQYIFLGIATLINIGYYVLIIKNGAALKKSVSE